MITVPVNTPWHIRLPTVFRYLPKKYVEQFFKDGTLRLSSFDIFSRHKNELRFDEKEGEIYGALWSREHNYLAETKAKFGYDSYVLCSSMQFKQDLMDEFECDSYIRINNLIQFGAAISKHIPGIVAGIEGACIYQDRKIFHKVTDKHKFNDVSSKQGVEAAMNQEMGQLPYFLKEKKYSSQLEYRIIWVTNHEVNGSLDIKVPEAIQFCEKPDKLTE